MVTRDLQCHNGLVQKSVVSVLRVLLCYTAVCDGECGSKHPHSAIYDETHLIFTITG